MSSKDLLSSINLRYHQEGHNCLSHHYCLIVPLLIICKQADRGDEDVSDLTFCHYLGNWRWTILSDIRLKENKKGKNHRPGLPAGAASRPSALPPALLLNPSADTEGRERGTAPPGPGAARRPHTPGQGCVQLLAAGPAAPARPDSPCPAAVPAPAAPPPPAGPAPHPDVPGPRGAWGS